MKKIIYFILFALPVLVMTSCLHDDNNIFDQSPALRMDEAIRTDKAVLIEASNGWIANYYPEKNHTVGGYAMYWKFFEDGTVDMACEIETGVKAQTISNSEWDIKPDMGPVLSFDVYNPVIHYFCNPSNSDLDGQGGDYEFVISKVSDDKNQMELRGKKNGNKLLLTKLASGVDPLDYLKQTAEMPRTVERVKNFKLTVNGTEIGTGIVSDTRKIDLKFNKPEEGDTIKNLYLTYTPTGFVLYEPLKVNGAEMLNFTWSTEAKSYIATDADARLYCTNRLPIPVEEPAGSGTAAAPYLISKKGHLASLANHLSAEFKLTADISLSDDDDWIPVGPFTGKLYGDGHAISNISVNAAATKVGLFGELGADAYIEGVNIVDGSITSTVINASAGAIAGHISGANVTILNCGNTATIHAPRGTILSSVGGIVGYIQGDAATISACFNKANITGGGYAGGIVGRAANAQNTVTIINCYSQAAVSTTVASSFAGGIAGDMNRSGSGTLYTLENCYASGSVTGTASAAGIVGRAWNNANAIVQHNVALQDNVTGNASGAAGIQAGTVAAGTTANFSSSAMLLNGAAKTDESAKNGTPVAPADAKTKAWYSANLPSWDFTNTWKITDGSLPTLTWEK